MIQAVATPAHRAEFLRRIAGKPYFAATMGTRCTLFGAHPASGWRFYLLPGTAALALRGGTAVLCGALPGGTRGEETAEELQGFLRFLGIDRLLAEQTSPPGWRADEPLLLWQLPQGRRLPQPPAPPPGLTLDEHPAMGPVSRLAFPDCAEEQDAFYAAACTAIAHGVGCCHALLYGGAPVCTVGCYEQSETEAFLSAGVTDPAWRGRGLAGWLIVRLANDLAAARTVRFASAASLRPFYTRLGFALGGTIPTFVQE